MNINLNKGFVFLKAEWKFYMYLIVVQSAFDYYIELFTNKFIKTYSERIDIKEISL